MYTKAPLNHDEWLVGKNKCRVKWKSKKVARGKRPKSNGMPPPESGVITKSSELALSKSIKEAFCAKFQVVEADVDTVLDDVMTNMMTKMKKMSKDKALNFLVVDK